MGYLTIGNLPHSRRLSRSLSFLLALPAFFLPQVRTSRTFIRDCTVASPLAILLFGGSLAVAHDSSYVQVDGWLRIRCACLGGGQRRNSGWERFQEALPLAQPALLAFSCGLQLLSPPAGHPPRRQL